MSTSVVVTESSLIFVMTPDISVKPLPTAVNVTVATVRSPFEPQSLEGDRPQLPMISTSSTGSFVVHSKLEDQPEPFEQSESEETKSNEESKDMTI